MINEELNALANAAKADNTKMWEVKAHYMGYIERLTQDNWYKMNNEADFIEDCYRRIEYAVRSFNEERGDFSGRVYALLQQGLRHYCGNRGEKRKALQLVGKEVNAIDRIDTAIDVEGEALDAVVRGEFYEKHCDREVDKLIVDIVFDTDHIESTCDIARRLAKKTGRSFGSARGAVRSFIKRKRVAS
ncbi:hypothetical protein CN980_00900 [Bacillus cereus]|uniref:Uncharacterized protein n=1 Tax=Bacillus cereus TaxID=1396 RepID=A0A9X7CGA7_BACCE|nr:hypothetical protein [Bacillus cereus]PGO82139.1 hypothetical protein CN980_00900 [Bacillus cereus]